MKFNTEICHAKRILLCHHTINAGYILGGCTLSMVTQYPYRGVTISNTMSLQNHINNTTCRANRVLGLVKRNLRGTSQKLRQQAYFSLVRPHLKYCSTVWNPYIKKDVNKIENIQRRAVRFVLNNCNQRGSVSALINHLCWNSPEKRTQLSCLLLKYMIQNQLIAINGNHCLTPMLPTCPVQGIIIQVYIRLSQIAFRFTAILSSHELSSGGTPFPGMSW